MPNALRLSTAAPTPVLARRKPISGITPAQSRTRQTLGGLNSMYKALTMAQKGGWQTVANTLNTNQGRTGKNKIHPANAFITLNAARLACGCCCLSDAPADLAAPSVLPPVTVQTSSPAADTAFALTLRCAAYPHMVQILASAPTPAGKTTFPDNTFKPLGSLPSLSGTAPIDITALYTAVYGTPPSGAQIALKLMAVSPAGIRLAPIMLVAIVIGSAQTNAPSALHLA